MTVKLMPPYTRSCGRTSGIALDRGPRFVRTRAMSRWHRVRHGVDYGTHRAFHVWCGQSVHDSPRRTAFLGRDRDPVDGVPVCGTCEGRAIGAGHDRNDGQRELLFQPYPRPPRWCPGRFIYVAIPDPRGYPRVGRCLACGATEPIRASSYGYAFSRVGLRQHEPLKLIAGCPFHAWQHLTNVNDQAVCRPCHRETA